MSERIPADLQAVGTPGLTVWAGTIQEEWDRRLRNRRNRMATWREMSEGDATVGALLFAQEALIRAAGYRIEPADDSPQAADAAAFIEAAFAGMDGAWGDTLAEVLSCLPYGFSLLEVLYRRDDAGRLTWQAWSPRAQETIDSWVFDPETGKASGAVQKHPVTGVEVTIPLARCLHFRARSRKGNPEGESILRRVFDAWWYRKLIKRIEAIGIERDLTGIPVALVPGSIIKDKGEAYQEYLKLVTSIRRDEQAGVLMPSDRDEHGQLKYQLTLLSTGGKRSIETDAIIGRYEREILRALLADFMTLGDNGSGSYAQSVSKIDLFLGAVSSFTESIADVINTQAIAPLCALNGITAVPTFTFNPLGRRDVEAFARTVATLASAGMIDGADPAVRAEVYDVTGLPAPEEMTAAATPVAAREPLRFADVTVDDARLLRARRLFDNVVDKRYRGLLDAAVVQG